MGLIRPLVNPSDPNIPRVVMVLVCGTLLVALSQKQCSDRENVLESHGVMQSFGHEVALDARHLPWCSPHFFPYVDHPGVLHKGVLAEPRCSGKTLPRQI